MCSLFGCTPQAEGRLKYPDIDKDKTEVLKKQVDGLVENVKDVFTFSFTFIRTVKEDLSMRIQEAHEGRLAKARSLGILEVEEPYPRQYKATFKLTVKKALEVLKIYGVDLDFQVHRTYLAKTETGKEIVDFPKRPTTDPPKTPRAGIESNMTPAKCPKINDRPPVPHIPTQTARVVVSHEFDILVGYFPDCYANREDFFEVRLGIWHEIMELAILALTMEALYWPLDLYHFSYINYIPNNFANNAVVRVQQRLRWSSEGERMFLYWPGDPPFDYFEVSAYLKEQEAERQECIAKAMEEVGNWARAVEEWKEAEKAWLEAVRAWQYVPHHPGRQKRINDAKRRLEEVRKRLAEAKIRKENAQAGAQRGATKQAPFWNVAGSGGEKITIHYSDWPHGFRAKILDYKERKVTEVSGTPGTKEGKVEWGKDADPGTYYVEVNISGERSEKVIIKKPLAWQAKVKFGSNGPYISITPKIGTKWPKGKGFGFSVHNSSGSTNKIGFVNVQDSNQTGEVTWGKESGQKFPKWGKYTIWAYAKDPGLQKMFEDKNFFPNWKTEVDIPVPSFKVNGAKASVAVAAKGPLIAPDTEQSLSIEYDNWPGKFEGIRQVSIDFFRVRSSIGKMRIMRFTLSLLVIGLLLIGVLGCKKQAEILSSQQAQPEPRTLRIYRDGIFERKIDVSGWEVGEDVIHLSGYNSYANDSFCYYYPWRGEDSIDYRIDEVYLFVNGIAVGSPLNPRRGLYHTLEDSCYFWKDSILTTWIDLTHWNDEDFGWGPWDQYPNLKVVRVSVDCHYPHTTLRHFFGYIESFIRHGRIAKFGVFYGQEEPPDSVDVYLYCLCLCDFCLRDQIEGINLKGIEIVGLGITTNLGLRFLRGAQDLRILALQSYRVNNFGLRHFQYLPELKELYIHCPKVDNRGVRYLKKLASLRFLYLGSTTNIDSSGVAEVRQTLPNCKVVKR